MFCRTIFRGTLCCHVPLDYWAHLSHGPLITVITGALWLEYAKGWLRKVHDGETKCHPWQKAIGLMGNVKMKLISSKAETAHYWHRRLREGRGVRQIRGWSISSAALEGVPWLLFSLANIPNLKSLCEIWLWLIWLL